MTYSPLGDTMSFTLAPTPNTAPVAFNGGWDTTIHYYRAIGSVTFPASSVIWDDYDADGDTLTIISVGNPSEGTITLINEGDSQKIVFVPDDPILGPEHVTFSYTISDGRGGTDTALGYIIPWEQDLPPLSFTLAEDTEITVGPTFHYRYVPSFSQPEHGEVIIREVSYGNLELVYIPSDDFNGTDEFLITYDDGGGLGFQTVNLTVTPVDEPTPTASYVRGTAGADTLDYASATTRVQIAGLEGNDTLRGGAVNDALNGGAGNDIITGGAGNDSITGGLGVDRMGGGAGNDTFHIALGDLALTGATDLIVDFQGAGQAGGDVIRFTGFAAGSTLELVGTSGNARVYEVQDGAGLSEGQILVSAGGALGQVLTISDYAFA